MAKGDNPCLPHTALAPDIAVIVGTTKLQITLVKLSNTRRAAPPCVIARAPRRAARRPRDTRPQPLFWCGRSSNCAGGQRTIIRPNLVGCISARPHLYNFDSTRVDDLTEYNKLRTGRGVSQSESFVSVNARLTLSASRAYSIGPAPSIRTPPPAPDSDERHVARRDQRVEERDQLRVESRLLQIDIYRQIDGGLD